MLVSESWLAMAISRTVAAAGRDCADSAAAFGSSSIAVAAAGSAAAACATAAAGSSSAACSAAAAASECCCSARTTACSDRDEHDGRGNRFEKEEEQLGIGKKQNELFEKSKRF